MLLITFRGGIYVLEFMVLGQVPGTHLYVDITLLINAFGGLLLVRLLYALLSRTIRRMFDKKVRFIQLELMSL